MKKYQVFIEEVDIYSVIVEASSPEEAEKLADDIVADGGGTFKDGSTEIVQVEELT